MSGFGWQQFGALALVALAAGYLARGAWRNVAAWRQAKAGCSTGCGGCASTANGKPLVTLEPRAGSGDRGA